jgi:hypothetical protein
MDLHIGVTDSDGTTYEFDRKGIQIRKPSESREDWSECLPIFLTPERRKSYTSSRPACPLWKEKWNDVLDTASHQSRWNSERYDVNSNNCFSFVLDFLRCLDVPVWERDLCNKTALCQTFILPVTTLAGKYISLYRQLCQQHAVIRSVWLFRPIWFFRYQCWVLTALTNKDIFYLKMLVTSFIPIG